MSRISHCKQDQCDEGVEYCEECEHCEYAGSNENDGEACRRDFDNSYAAVALVLSRDLGRKAYLGFLRGSDALRQMAEAHFPTWDEMPEPARYAWNCAAMAVAKNYFADGGWEACERRNLVKST